MTTSLPIPAADRKLARRWLPELRAILHDDRRDLASITASQNATAALGRVIR